MWHHATATGTICTVAARTDPVGIKLRTHFSAYNPRLNPNKKRPTKGGPEYAGAPERTRTSDARFRKPTLYPLSYGGKKDADKQLCYLNTPLLHSI